MGALLLAAVLAAAPPKVEVQTLDGQTVSGPIVKLDANQVTVNTADGTVSLEIDKLIRLFPKNKPGPAGSQPGAWVELVDGSSLVAQQYTVREGRARIALLDNQVVELPVAGVSHVRLRAEPEQLAAEWARILEMKINSDLLVVYKDEVVNYHKGVLRDVTDEVVQFELDGEVLPVKRSKVCGLVYVHPPQTLPEAICQISDAAGSVWSVRSFALQGDLEWTTAGGLTLTRPLASITQIDFSRGKIVYLSDLEPESVTFTPYFGRGEALPLLARFYALREDRNFQSGPLQLEKKTYKKGLALHSRTKVVYRLPGRFSRFRAIVGIDDSVRPRGNLHLVISGDDRVLLETAVTGADPPKPVELDLSGVRRIAILADFGEEMDVADHLDLCEARILK